jgi:hypothetical protein
MAFMKAEGFWIVALLAALSGAFSIGWQVNGWRLSSVIAQIEQEQAEAAAKASETARAVEQGWQAQYQNAIRSRDENVKKLETDLARARAHALGLRDDLARLGDKLSTSPDAACSRVGSAALDVFGSCVAEYLSLAAEADQCGIDRRTLIDAWPRAGNPVYNPQQREIDNERQ